MVHSFKRTVRPRPSVIFNVFLDKLKPIWTFLASNELAKGGSVRQKTHFYGKKMPKMTFSLSPVKPALNALGIHPGPMEHAWARAHAERKPIVPTYPPPLRIRSPRGPPKGRPPFPSSLYFEYMNLVQWSGLLIYGRPTTHFSTAY